MRVWWERPWEPRELANLLADLVLVLFMLSILLHFSSESKTSSQECQTRRCSPANQMEHNIAQQEGCHIRKFRMANYFIRAYHKLSKLFKYPSPHHLTSHHHREIMSNVIGNVFLQFISNHNEGQAWRHNQCLCIDSDFYRRNVAEWCLNIPCEKGSG